MIGNDQVCIFVLGINVNFAYLLSFFLLGFHCSNIFCLGFHGNNIVYLSFHGNNILYFNFHGNNTCGYNLVSSIFYLAYKVHSIGCFFTSVTKYRAYN